MPSSRFFLGKPAEFKDICKVYPPTINEMVENPRSNLYIKLLTLSQDEIFDEAQGWINGNFDIDPTPKTILTPFEYLLNMAYNDPQIAEVAKSSFHFFTREEVTFLYEGKIILFGDWENAERVEDIRFLKEEDYFDFQNLVRLSIGAKAPEKFNPDEDIRVARIKAKTRFREKIAAKQHKGTSFDSVIRCLCTMGIGVSPFNIGELSYAAALQILRTYQEKEHYNIEMQWMMHAADPSKIKPTHWMKDLD